MKKAIVLALALSAACAQAGDITLDFTTHGHTGYTPSASSPNVTSDITFTVVSGGVSPSGISSDNKADVSYGETFLTPDVDIQGSNSWTYTLVFKVNEDFKTNSVSFALGLTNNKLGYWTWASRDMEHTFTLSGEGLTNISSTKTATHAKVDTSATDYIMDWDDWAIEDGSGATLTFNLGGVQTFKAGKEYTLTLKTQDADTNQDNLRIGLAGIRFNAVPEPATATLSLLALAGLCARRRRK